MLFQREPVKTLTCVFRAGRFLPIESNTAIGDEAEVPVFKIERPATFIQEIKKSRFRAIAAPVRDEDDARAFLKSSLDISANHNCWAWRIGQAYRFSDDGEPSGTAGKPILQAIDGLLLDGVAVLVTRWFGGILLGSGGLMRAYGGTASQCLKAAERIPFVATISITVACHFGDLALLEARLAAVSDATIRSRHFTDFGAELLVDVPDKDAVYIAGMIINLTSGSLDFRTAE